MLDPGGGEAADRARRGGRGRRGALRARVGVDHRVVPLDRRRLDRPTRRTDRGDNGSSRHKPRTNIVKVVAASMAGTTVEWYDFFLYGVAAALVFPQVFFPASDPAVGTLLVARHLRDRVHRPPRRRPGLRPLRRQASAARSCWSLSLLMMGAATFAIGLLPGYATIGVLAPVLLVVLRLIQGFALGGEWGGAVLIVSEHGDPARRGYWASWPQAGVPLGPAAGQRPARPARRWCRARRRSWPGAGGSRSCSPRCWC